MCQKQKPPFFLDVDLYQIVFNYIIINKLYVASSHYISDPFLKVINGLAADQPSGSSNRCCSFEHKQESNIVWLQDVMNHSEIMKHFSIIIKKQRDKNLDQGICLRTLVSNIFTQQIFLPNRPFVSGLVDLVQSSYNSTRATIRRKEMSIPRTCIRMNDAYSNQEIITNNEENYKTRMANQ